jgi:hypothetical protein
MAKRKLHKPKAWWKQHEEVAAVFERLFHPLEKAVVHDTRRRDVVGQLRQLDVGVIDNSNKQVHSLVEVQKRKAKVGIEDFGNWVYKRDTLNAKELVVVSEMGFSNGVIEHVKKLHPNRVRLGRLHHADTGFIERINSTCLGITRVWDLWWIASIFVQYQDADEIEFVTLNGLDTEAKIFGAASPMDLVRHMEKSKGNQPASIMHSFIFDVTGPPPLSFNGRPLKRVLITTEKQQRIWEPVTRFYAYDEIHPTKFQKGIAIISTFRVDASRKGALKMVIVPDDEGVGGDARIAGQFEFVD